MSKPITQREARRLRKRVQELEELEQKRCNAWAREYPGGVNIDTFEVTRTQHAIVETARKLGHAVVVVSHSVGDKRELLVYALPLAKESAPAR